MKHCLKAASVIILAAVISCSTINNSKLSGNEYQIDYSVGGGFTGLTNGITINSNGEVKFWQRIAAGSLKQKDSLRLNDNQLRTFNKSLQDSSIFTYKFNNTGNITTTLAIKSDELTNKISFKGTEPPVNMPENLIELINKIKKLYSRGKDKL